MSINNTVLSGLLGDAPQIRTLNSGKRVATLRLATETFWRKSDETFGRKTSWHTIETFNEFVIKNLEGYCKGDKVTVAGELDYDIYDGKSGDKQVRAKIVIQRNSQITNANRPNTRKEDSQEDRPQDDMDDQHIPF